MAVEDRFKQSVIVTLAKRAANRCSNPNCGAITSGLLTVALILTVVRLQAARQKNQMARSMLAKPLISTERILAQLDTILI